MKTCRGGVECFGRVDRAFREAAIPSSCGMLVYREVTSMVTRMVFSGSGVGRFKIV